MLLANSHSVRPGLGGRGVVMAIVKTAQVLFDFFITIIVFGLFTALGFGLGVIFSLRCLIL